MRMRRAVTLLSTFVAVALGVDCSASAPEGLPRLDFESPGGCGNIFVFKANAEESEFILVRADANQLGLERGREESFTIGNAIPGLEVWVDLYDGSPLAPPYCVGDDSGEEPSRWTAAAGRVSITLQDSDEAPFGQFEAEVVLSDMTLEDAAGRRVEQRDPIQIVAVVGWFAR